MTDKRAELVGRPLSRMEWLAVCCWVSGMTATQTAQSLRLTNNTARSYLNRARAKRGAYVPRVLVDPGPAPYWPSNPQTRTAPTLTTKETP